MPTPSGIMLNSDTVCRPGLPPAPTLLWKAAQQEGAAPLRVEGSAPGVRGHARHREAHSRDRRGGDGSMWSLHSRSTGSLKRNPGEGYLVTATAGGSAGHSPAVSEGPKGLRRDLLLKGLLSKSICHLHAITTKTAASTLGRVQRALQSAGLMACRTWWNSETV